MSVDFCGKKAVPSSKKNLLSTRRNPSAYDTQKKTFASNSCARTCSTWVGWRVVCVWFGGGPGGCDLGGGVLVVGGPGGGRSGWGSGPGGGGRGANISRFFPLVKMLIQVS